MQSPDLLYLSADFLFSSLELKLTQVISVIAGTTFLSSSLSFFHRLATVTSICRSLYEISVKIGNAVMGLITSETTDQLIMRDMASQEHQLAKAVITEHTQMPNSIMPTGLMHNLFVKEFAPLLDYIVGLPTKK